ncbi:MAG: SMC-Scp complex subunit ScpB [Candidatus Bipolaricaulota bacterium]|jgi:segregation and condensation protein B|nr:SMC-Scp complex subunit ScpB [Candidatus Bipolaricaulota bacterium]
MTSEDVDTRTRDKALLEAALFLTEKPIPRKTLASVLGQASIDYVDQLLEELAGELAAPQRGLELLRRGDTAQLQVKRTCIGSVAHLAPHQDVPRPVLRSLAMIAYNHPMTQSALVKARGNKAYGHVQELVERGLVRPEEKGRTLLLHVTDEFLRYFGLESVEEFRFHAEAPTSEG